MSGSRQTRDLIRLAGAVPVNWELLKPPRANLIPSGFDHCEFSVSERAKTDAIPAYKINIKKRSQYDRIERLTELTLELLSRCRSEEQNIAVEIIRSINHLVASDRENVELRRVAREIVKVARSGIDAQELSTLTQNLSKFSEWSRPILLLKLAGMRGSVSSEDEWRNANDEVLSGSSPGLPMLGLMLSGLPDVMRDNLLGLISSNIGSKQNFFARGQHFVDCVQILVQTLGIDRFSALDLSRTIDVISCLTVSQVSELTAFLAQVKSSASQNFAVWYCRLELGENRATWGHSFEAVSNAFRQLLGLDVPLEYFSYSALHRLTSKRNFSELKANGSALTFFPDESNDSYFSLIQWPETLARPIKSRELDNRNFLRSSTVPTLHGRFVICAEYARLIVSSIGTTPERIAFAQQVIDSIFFAPTVLRVPRPALARLIQAVPNEKWASSIVAGILIGSVPLNESLIQAIEKNQRPPLKELDLESNLTEIYSLICGGLADGVPLPELKIATQNAALLAGTEFSPLLSVISLKGLIGLTEKRPEENGSNAPSIEAYRDVMSRYLSGVSEIITRIYDEYPLLSEVVNSGGRSSNSGKIGQSNAGPPAFRNEQDSAGRATINRITREAFETMQWSIESSFGFSALTIEFRKPHQSLDSIGMRFAKKVSTSARALMSETRDTFPGYGIAFFGIDPNKVFVADRSEPKNPFYKYEDSWPWSEGLFEDLPETLFAFRRGLTVIMGPDTSDYVHAGRHMSLLVYNEHFPKATRFPAFLVESDWLRSRLFKSASSEPFPDALQLMKDALSHHVTALPLVWSPNLSGLHNSWPAYSQPYFGFEHLLYSDRSRDSVGHLHLSHVAGFFSRWNVRHIRSDLRILETLKGVHHEIGALASRYRSLQLLERLSRSLFKKGQAISSADSEEAEAFEQEGLSELDINSPTFLMLREMYTWHEQLRAGELAPNECPVLRVGSVRDYSQLPAPFPQFSAATKILSFEDRSIQFPEELSEIDERHLLLWLKAFKECYSRSDLEFRLCHPLDLISDRVAPEPNRID